MKLSPFALAMVLAAPLQVSVAKTVSLGGVMNDQRSGNGIAAAEVTLTRQRGGSSTGPQSYVVETREDGTFVFPNMEAGVYRIAAARNGYVQKEWTLSLPAEAPATVVSLAMMPAAVIRGRITDRGGQSMEGAEVRAARYVHVNGEATLRVVRTVITDDLGEYRLSGLSPGRYWISALPLEPERPAPPPSVFGGGDVADFIRPLGGGSFAPIYFPGTPKAKSGSAIDLHAGDLRNGVDIVVAPIQTRAIRGVISNPSGQPIRMTLSPRFEDFVGRAPRSSVDAVSGAFEFLGVTPGSYVLVAASAGTAGRALIDVEDADVAAASIQLAQSVNVTGRLRVEGAAAGSRDPDMTGLRVALRSDPAGAMPGLTSAAAPVASQPGVSNLFPLSSDGMFRFQALSGDYRMGVTGLPAEMYVKSIVLGSADILNDGLHIDGSPDGNIEILIGGRSAALSGVAVDKGGRPVANATVVLIPGGSRIRRYDLYRTASSDAMGRFQIRGIVPGDYKMFAWEHVETEDWTDPEFVKQDEDRGETIRLQEADRQTRNVRTIPPRF